MTEQQAIGRVHCCMHIGDEITLEARDMAILALEKQEKYRWHDLRKNPDDLPSEKDPAYTWYECVHENYEEDLCRPYYQFDNGEFGYWRDKYHPVSLGFIDSEFETIDDMNLEKVIAWRYIEPFEEEESDGKSDT